MEGPNKKGVDSIIGAGYANIGEELLNSRRNIFNTLINNRIIPDKGLDELTIELILNTIASMDSNNGLNHIGIGEREGRVISSLVLRRNYGLVHGMGRSGDISELQPKAVGSSLLVKLTRGMTLNLLHSIGMTFVKNLIILPFATGMSITLTFLTLKIMNPQAKYIIWSRIDQKTCFKSMLTSGLIPIIVEPLLVKDELITNVREIQEQIKLLGRENILCVFSTTSCFAPRGYDDVKEISLICKLNNIPHVCNNAYGIYCTKIIDLLNQSHKNGRIDILISSTDKNFLVPVGGSLIYSSDEEIVDKIKKNYPGRASSSPIIDLFISFLQMGKSKYKQLISARKDRYLNLKEMMKKISSQFGERILDNPNNKISLAMTLGEICSTINTASKQNDITYLGSLFYSRQISGIKVISPSKETDIGGYKFTNYGSHSEKYPYVPYCVFACGIGITQDEIDQFGAKFVEIIKAYRGRNKISKEISEICTDVTTTEESIHKKEGKDLTTLEMKITNMSISNEANLELNIK